MIDSLTGQNSTRNLRITAELVEGQRLRHRRARPGELNQDGTVPEQRDGRDKPGHDLLEARRILSSCGNIRRGRTSPLFRRCDFPYIETSLLVDTLDLRR